MHLMTKILLILALLVLSACASSPGTELPDPVIIKEYVRAECGNPPERTPVNLRPLSWQVIDSRFTLSPEGYEDLSYNVSMILLGIRELQAEVEFYERCLSSSPQKQDTNVDSNE